MAAAKTNTPLRQKASRIHAHVRRHYYAYMPNKKHHRILVWVAFFIVAGVIAAQLLYPPDRAVPLARLDNMSVGGHQDVQLTKQVTEQFTDSKLKLEVPGGSALTETVSKTGATLQPDEMVGALVAYPFWQRFIPFSLLFHWPHVTTAQVSYTDSILQTFGVAASQKLSHPPTNARLAIKDGKLVATSDKAGVTVKAADVVRAVRLADIPLGGTDVLHVPVTQRPAVTTSADLEAVRVQAEAALARPVTITISGQTFTPSHNDIASWLAIGTDAKGRPALTFDRKQAGSYLDGLNKQVGTPAGQTDITLVDGKEKSRTTGKTGREIDQPPLLDSLNKWIINGQGASQQTATLVDVAPSVIYNHRFTATQAGLQAYVDYITSTEDVHIALQQLDGNGWSAYGRSSDSVVSASTYKLYVAQMLFSRIDSGQSHWSDQMQGTTARTCFDQMIVQSLNNCAEDWIQQFGGGSALNSFLYGRGFSHATTFTAPDAAHTSANDLLKALLGLYNGSLYSGNNRSILLNDMGRQIYRNGVPAGSKGSVQDKVGFLWDYNHDAAIVHTAKGSYAVVIMTKGQSFAEIAAITRELEAIMYP